MKFIKQNFFFIFWVIALFIANRGGYLNDGNHLAISASSHIYKVFNSPDIKSSPPALVLFDDATFQHFNYPIIVPRASLAELLNKIPDNKYRRIGIDIDLSISSQGRRSAASDAADKALAKAIKRHTDAGTEVFAVRNSVKQRDHMYLPPSPLDSLYEETPNLLWVQANYMIDSGSGFSEAQLVEAVKTNQQTIGMPHWGVAQTTTLSFQELRDLNLLTPKDLVGYSAVLRFFSFNNTDATEFFSRHSWLDVLDHGLRGTRGDQVIIAANYQASNDWHSTFLNPTQEPGISLNLNAALTLQSVGPLKPHNVFTELALLIFSLIIFIWLTPEKNRLWVAAMRLICLTLMLLVINQLSINTGYYFSSVFSILSVQYIRSSNFLIGFSLSKLKKRRAPPAGAKS